MAKAITRAETKRSLLLWFGILAAPLAWTVQIAIGPDLNEILCGPGATGSGRSRLYGLDMKVALLAMTAGLLAIGILGGLAAFRCRHRLGRSSDTTEARRASWMALAGILVSSLFVLAMAVNLVPFAFLSACEAAL